MRIDAHQHFWTYTPETQAWIDDSMEVLKRDFLPQHLKVELDAGGFDGSVVVQAPQTLEETRWLLKLAGHNPFIKGVVGWVDLRAKDVRDQLKAFAANPKFKGVRHIAQAEPDERFLVGAAFTEGVAALGELGLTYDILVFPRQLSAAAELAGKFPKQPFVLDHIAKPEIKAGKMSPWREGIKELAKHPNVYCKVSGLVTEADWQNWKPEDLKPYLEVVFKAFGPQRLMAGSDWPVCLLAADYGPVMATVRDFIEKMPREDQDAILGGNAAKFYKL